MYKCKVYKSKPYFNIEKRNSDIIGCLDSCENDC